MRDNLPGVGWVGGDVLAYLRNWMLWTLAEHADEGAAKTRPRPTFVAIVVVVVVLVCQKRNTIRGAEVSFMFLLMSYLNIIFLINYNRTCVSVYRTGVCVG